eukprot:275051_1
MTTLCLTIIHLICCTFTLSYSANWNAGSPNISFTKSGHAVGYDELQNEIILIGGGYFGRKQVAGYNITDNTFTEYDYSLTIQGGSSQFYTQINNLLYMINTKYPNYYLSVFQLNTRTLTQNYHNTSFPYQVSSGSCLTNWNNNYIIVIGGNPEGIYSNDVAIYSISDNMWLPDVPKLQISRSSASCIASNNPNNNNVYVFGGATNVWNQTKTIEKLDLYELIINKNTNIKWSYNNDPLSSSKSGTRVVIHGENAYIIGGSHWKNRSLPLILSEVDILNFVSDTVSPFVALKYGVHKTGAIVVDDILYAFGGTGLSRSRPVDIWQYFNLPTISVSISSSIDSDSDNNSESIEDDSTNSDSVSNENIIADKVHGVDDTNDGKEIHIKNDDGNDSNVSISHISIIVVLMSLLLSFIGMGIGFWCVYNSVSNENI